MRAAGANSSASASRKRFRAGDVVRAVEQHERMPADDLEPPRRPHARERVAHDVGVERRADERLRRGERDRRVVGLVRAVQRDEHVGIARIGREEVEHAPAERGHVGAHTEVDVAPQHARRRRGP